MATIGRGAGGGSGWVIIADATPNSGGTVTSKVFQNPPDNSVIQSFVSSDGEIDLLIRSGTPVVSLNGGGDITLSPAADGGHYQDLVPHSAGASGDIIVTAKTPDGDGGATDTTSLTLDLPPNISAGIFTGGKPGIQTELKQGDLVQFQVTADKAFNNVVVSDFGAAEADSVAVASGLSATITLTVADRGTTPQALAARISVLDTVTGAPSATFDSDTPGTVEDVNVVTLNNLAPSFVDNGTTFPATQNAFSGTQTGSQDTTVNNADSAAYTSPHGDFTITLPNTLAAVKALTCTNPGDYNDSSTNFRIVATRDANDASTTFDKTIEVADIAPVVTTTQPATRLRSGGNDGTSVQSHVITATSNQNLAVAPGLTVPVGGTFQGGGFVGGPKVWTRTIDISDDDAKGIAAWAFSSTPTNNANTPASITGSQNNGGFVSRTLVVPAFAATVVLNTEVVDFAKLQAGNFSPGGPSSKQSIGTTADTTNGYTIDAVGVNPTSVELLDQAAVAANSLGLYNLSGLEETV